VAPRFLDFPSDISRSSNTRRLIETLPPGERRSRAIAAYERELEKQSEKLESLSKHLKDYVLQFDTVQLISAISFLTNVSSIADYGPHDAGETFTYEAKIEYLVGLALSAPPGSIQVDLEAAQTTLQKIGEVFDAAFARMFLTSSGPSEAKNFQTEQAAFLLIMERLYDRMRGYPIHVQEIDDEIFHPHRDFYVDHLGFCPSDASLIVRKAQRSLNDELERAASRTVGPENATADDPYKDAYEAFISVMKSSSLWHPVHLNELTGVPIEQIGNLLSQISAEFGCQPDFLTPLDENKARSHPTVKLDHGGYLVANPWMVVACIHPWIEEFIKASGDQRFAKRYEGHRSAASERLVKSTFSSIFGADAVYGGQHYDGNEGHGEVDCLVCGELSVIVEVKSRSLTERGRRGHQPRVETVISDVIDTSIDQTKRAAEFVRDGGRMFSNEEGGILHTRLPDDPMEPIEIVIIRERMDPVTMQAFSLDGSTEQRPVWITSLVDLLMVKHFLDDPTSFLHYAKTRGHINQKGVQVYVEADALGAYLQDRLKTPLEFALNGENDPEIVMLGASSGEINAYYTWVETGLPVILPSTGVPVAVREALRATSPGLNRTWWEIADGVMQYELKRWKVWKKFINKRAPERIFTLDGNIALLVSSGRPASVSEENGRYVLTIPKRLFD
jgi:hypothetical protein